MSRGFPSINSAIGLPGQQPQNKTKQAKLLLLNLYCRTPPNKDRHNGHMRSNGYTYRARSLPNMKLEPLLGNRAKYKLNTASLLDLKSITGIKLKFIRSKFLDQLPVHDDSTKGNRKSEVRSDEVTVSDPLTKAIEEVDSQSKLTATVEDSPQSRPMRVTVRAPGSRTEDISADSTKPPKQPSTFRSLGKPRKSKRLKFKKSQLEAIEEDDRESLQRLSRSSSYNLLPRPLPMAYNPGATVEMAENYLNLQQSIEERRRDVALLRKINSSTTSTKQSSQISIQSLARKKLRRLPSLTSMDSLD